MGTSVFGSPVKAVRGETVALTTTAAHLAYQPGYQEVMFYCSSAWRMGIAPALMRVLYFDTSESTYTDYTPLAIDRSSSTHVPLDAMATGDILYMGFDVCPRGVYFDLDDTNKNDTVATLDVEFYNGSAWTDVSGDSDGTSSSSKTLAQDGLYTWTLPASVQTSVNNILNLHWIRFKPSTALSATIDVIEIIPAAVDTNYAYMEGGLAYQFALNPVRNGAFEFDHTATGTLNVTWIQH